MVRISSPKFMSKMVHTPLGPRTTWVHILLKTLDVLVTYTMTHLVESGRSFNSFVHFVINSFII
jgi:hypothetical protein